MKTKNYDSVMVDVFTMTYVGGTGTETEVARQLVEAIDEYNERNGTKLVLSIATDEDLPVSTIEQIP